MRAANPKTELVDWKVLSGKGDRGKSDELMRHVATLFSLTANHCTAEQIDTYDLVMQRLADLVCEETRSFAAQKISGLENAPREIVRRFAFDVINVADPVLRHSPVLTDDDLVEISALKGEDHMVSICMRKTLSKVVTDVLIQSEHGSVMIKLAANSHAELTSAGMNILSKAAANDQTLSEELAKRAHAERQTSREQHQFSGQIGKVQLPSLWDDIAETVSEKSYDLSRHSYLSRYRFDASLNKVQKLARQGLLDKGLLRQFASNDQFADLVSGVAHMSGFPHQIIARMMSSLHWEQVLSLFKLLGFTDQLVQDTLECGPWMLCLSKNQCISVVKQYRLLSVEDAKSQALLWPEHGLLLD